MSQISNLFDILTAHETKFARSFSFIPSENTVSPLSRMAYFSDAISRYYFNEHDVFGQWSFQGGSIAGRIQNDILMPLLMRIAGASFADVRAISGLTAMTVALSAFARRGEKVLSVPVAFGGHPDTQYVARKLGYEPLDIPFADWATPDLKLLSEMVEREQPALVYLDHATCLFPLDLKQVVAAIRAAARRPVHIHADSSHVTALIWGGVLPNPLACGADSYGGSTHKTFPGPHKAVILTNRPDVSENFTMTAVNMISHHHLASVIALAITLIEFDECQGAQFARQTVANSKAFAAALNDEGLDVQGRDKGYSDTHQVWVASPEGRTAHAAGSHLFNCGLIVNPHNPIPSLGQAGIRIGLNEVTRLGCGVADVAMLARFMARALTAGTQADKLADQIAEFRSGFSVRYCFDAETTRDIWGRFVASFADGRKAFFG